ncbi:MAG: calcium:proton antiporter [Nitrospira sp.]|jgi:Ca2+:H+ antiporter|nr:calcium:proton antiporter [Nitrospira sp.]MCC7472473.1 calcium:proton antiporter [Candidatus Nomurabacteria bacterium]
MLSLVTSTPQDSSLLRFPHRTAPPHRSRIFGEWWLIIPVGTAVLFFLHGHEWLSDLSNPLRLSAMLGWLLLVIVLSAFAVLRHAEHLAARLGEPLGTVILTLSVTGIEVMMIAAFMYTGNGNASLARDAMFAVVMLVLNGMVGLSLLLGGLRYHEQTYNLQGANAFLAVIVPLAALGLVMPNYTVSSSGPTFSPHQSVFLIIMSLGLYGVFLAIQNLRHRDYFVAPRSSKKRHATILHQHHPSPGGSVWFHTLLLLAYLLPLVILSEHVAVPIDHTLRLWHAPPTLGGVLVAGLVLAPESLGAVRAALANQLQRSVNILLGSVLASISLTIPAVLAIGFVTGSTIILGIDAVDTILLILTFVVSMLTFAVRRTNVLLGAVHLLLFLAYLMLIFEK